MQIEELRKELGDIEVPNNGNFYALKKIEQYPDRVAIKFPRIERDSVEYESLTFLQFKEEALKIAAGLNKAGFKKGNRIILLFPISVDLYLTIFACFHLGIVPVFIDSTMSTKKLIQGVRDSNANAIISVDKLLKFRIMIPNLWFKKCFCIDKKRWFFKHLSQLTLEAPYKLPEEKLNPNSEALITFTSGSTGRPKGANRSIDILLNQKIVSEYHWPHSMDEIDMPAFPMITLQNLGCGITSILPAIDFQNHLGMDASLIVEQIVKEKITRFSAQPFFIEKICDYIIKNNIKIVHVKSIVVGGAVVSRPLCLKIMMAFPESEANIVYGSTEAEPIAHINIKEFSQSNKRGILVGKIVNSLEVNIIDPLNVSDIKLTGDIGEITLSGPHVIKEYIDNHPANKILKIKSKDGKIWHRTGDLGYFDDDNNLWLVGRLKDQIESEIGAIPCYDLEEQLLAIKGIKRAAFINTGKILFIEKKLDQEIDFNEVKSYLASNSLSAFTIKCIKTIPVDRRHFSRIDREELAKLSN